jgi:hypothetical protein
VEQNFIPSQGNLCLGNCACHETLLGNGEPNPGAGDIDGRQTHQHGDGGKDFKIDQGLQSHAAQGTHLSVGCDARDQSTEDQWGNNGFDEPQEDIAEHAQANRKTRGIDAQFRARNHGPKNPRHQGTTANGWPKKQSQTGQPQA